MPDIAASLTTIFAELVTGVQKPGTAFVLNTGDAGLLVSLDTLSAEDASRSTNDGATIAAHAQHVRYGLSLMNRWLREGGNPFADATWDEAWKLSRVDDREWRAIRQGLRTECEGWQTALASRAQPTTLELKSMIGSIAHLGYHLGAIRQIHKGTRGPKEGTFVQAP